MDIFALIPQFGGIVWTIVAFVVALSVIVAVHEYGHYIVGRWSGIHADVFSLGFGPVLFSRVDKHGTKWQFALLPFGGYVKFMGDANAASGKDGQAMEEAAVDPVQLRRTMHGAPLWARAATVAAGPAFNFIMSILVFAGVFLFSGVASDPMQVGQVRALPGQSFELQPGDTILEIDGAKMPSFEDAEAFNSFSKNMPVLPVLDYLVERDGQELTVGGPYLMPALVQNVSPQGAAHTAELKPGDVIVSVDETPIFAFDQLKAAVEGSNGRALLLGVWRAGEELEFALKPKRVDEPLPEGGFQTQWRIGIAGGMAIEPATVTPGLGEAVGGAVAQTWRIINGSISGLYHIIAGKISTCNLSGPVGIAKTSGAMASQGMEQFIWFIAVLSTAVGLLNLFPIPALDGGHLVFYAFEAVTGRPPSDRALQALMAVGLTMILSLMVFALWNDFFC